MSSKRPPSLTKEGTDKKERADSNLASKNKAGPEKIEQSGSKSPANKRTKDGSQPSVKINDGSQPNANLTTALLAAGSRTPSSSEKPATDVQAEAVGPKKDPILNCDPLRCVPSKETWATMKCNPISCIPNGCIQPEQYYACDREVAKSLAQYLSPEERKKVQAWLVTLEQMTLDDDELSERFMYMTCLVMLLKFGQLVPPFTRFPPARPLRSLREHIDKHLFKKVQIECRRRRLDEWDKYVQPDRIVEQKPTQFLYQMPIPNNGIFCYGAAFSTM